MARRISELEEAAEHYDNWMRSIWKKRLERRLVIKGATLLALGGAAAIPELLAACTKAPEPSPEQAGSSSLPGSPTKTAQKVWQDTTITPPYTMGDPNAVVDDRWMDYPYVYKYNFRRYNWSVPVSAGGHVLRTWGPPANYNLMDGTSGVIYASLYLNGLVRHAIHEGVNLDTIAMELDLAESAEHNADYTEWTFKLFKGVKFHNIPPVNGREMTADDVMFSFQRHMDTSAWANPLRVVDKVSAPDKYTVKFTMKQPAVSFLATLGLPYFPVFAKEHFENKDLFTSRPIGTGPFMLTYSKYQDKSEAVRHPEYFARPVWMKEKYRNLQMPFVDAITHQYYANDAEQRAAFIAAKADDYYQTYLDPAVLKDVITAVPKAQVTVNASWGSTPSWIAWNHNNKIFADVRVRRALSMAIDRKAIVNNVLAGAGVPGSSPIPFDLQGLAVPPPLEDYGPYWQYNPGEAKKLLAEAGYPNGFKAELEVSSPASGTNFNIFTAVVDMWRRNLGVNVEVVAKDPLIVQNDRLKKTFNDLIAPASIQGYDGEAFAAYYYYPGSANNWGSVNDPELTAAMDKMRMATSPEALLDATRTFLKRFYDQVPQLYICWTQGLTISHPWLHGNTNTNYSFLTYFGLNNWRSVWIDSTAPDGRGGKEV